MSGDAVREVGAAFDRWYSTQAHQLSNEDVCRLIWNRAWEAALATPPAAEPARRWPFVEPPGEIAERIAGWLWNCHTIDEDAVLAAVRHAIIERGVTLTPPAAEQGEAETIARLTKERDMWERDARTAHANWNAACNELAAVQGEAVQRARADALREALAICSAELKRAEAAVCADEIGYEYLAAQSVGNIEAAIRALIPRQEA